MFNHVSSQMNPGNCSDSKCNSSVKNLIRQFEPSNLISKTTGKSKCLLHPTTCRSVRAEQENKPRTRHVSELIMEDIESLSGIKTGLNLLAHRLEITERSLLTHCERKKSVEKIKTLSSSDNDQSTWTTSTECHVSRNESRNVSRQSSETSTTNSMRSSDEEDLYEITVDYSERHEQELIHSWRDSSVKFGNEHQTNVTNSNHNTSDQLGLSSRLISSMSPTTKDATTIASTNNFQNARRNTKNRSPFIALANNFNFEPRSTNTNCQLGSSFRFISPMSPTTTNASAIASTTITSTNNFHNELHNTKNRDPFIAVANNLNFQPPRTNANCCGPDSSWSECNSRPITINNYGGTVKAQFGSYNRILPDSPNCQCPLKTCS